MLQCRPKSYCHADIASNISTLSPTLRRMFLVCLLQYPWFFSCIPLITLSDARKSVPIYLWNQPHTERMFLLQNHLLPISFHFILYQATWSIETHNTHTQTEQKQWHKHSRHTYTTELRKVYTEKLDVKIGLVRDWRSTPTYCQLQSHVTQKLWLK